MKVFVYSARTYDFEPLQRAAQGRHDFVFTEKRLNKETAVLAKGYVAICIFTADDASPDVLQILHSYGVQYLLLRSAGYDHVGMEKAKMLNMRVMNAPDYSPFSVAEHAVALLMALNRKIVTSQELLNLQDFRLDTLMGADIHGKTIGVIGTGRIGVAFARIMQGFGATLLANDVAENPEVVALGIKYVSLDTLLTDSDVVSIHCPLTQATKYLIGKAQFDRMKPSCILINVSRGAIVKTSDLVDALEERKIGGACLDVYEFENGLFFQDNRNEVIHDVLYTKLRALRNVIMTGHQGFLTAEAIKGIADRTIQNIDCCEQGKDCTNEIYWVPKR